MGKASVILEEKESLVDVFRYFEYEGGKYVIFGEGHNGDDEYTTLHFSKLNDEGVAVKIEDEEEWNKLKGMIKVIVKEAKAGEVTSIADLDELELKNAKVEGSKVFKLNAQVAYVLASNKNYTRFSDFEGEEAPQEEVENDEEVKQEEAVEDTQEDQLEEAPKPEQEESEEENTEDSMPSFELPNNDESDAMPSFELPKEDEDDDTTDMTKEYEINNEEENNDEESSDIEQKELTSFELPEEEKEEEPQEEEAPAEEQEQPEEEQSDEEDPYTQSINSKIHTLEELLGEQIVERKEEPVEEAAEEQEEQPEEETPEPEQEEKEEVVEKPVDDEKDKIIEELKAKVEEHEMIINKLREVLK